MMPSQNIVPDKIKTLIVGGGQAGLALSEHLGEADEQHLIVEQYRIAERWRTARWDSLVANGPAWHDRFPSKEFANIGPDEFATKDDVVTYFEEFAEQINAPIVCGVEVKAARRLDGDQGILVESSDGAIEVENLVVATGPFQQPVIPPVIPSTADIVQIHSHDYKNPQQLKEGGVLVVGAGSSGGQIAAELLQSGREVYLSVGPHDRPPRRYRGKDFVWWLGVLGKWEAKTPPKGKEHVTISVSGADGGHTVDFRRLADKGMNLVGMTKEYRDGLLWFESDLVENIKGGDKNYLSVLQEADAYVENEGLDLPLEPEAHIIQPMQSSMLNSVTELDLTKAGISTVVWATGYSQNFNWLNFDVFDQAGNPKHHRGVTQERGLYFLGLPWLSMRGSSFIWGVWQDARYLAEQISKKA